MTRGPDLQVIPVTARTHRPAAITLREIPTEDLVIALKTASDEMKEQVFANVSSRAADQIREEADLLPPMKLSEIETIQMGIVDIARRLEEEGTLTIDAGGGGDDVLV